MSIKGSTVIMLKKKRKKEISRPSKRVPMNLVMTSLLTLINATRRAHVTPCAYPGDLIHLKKFMETPYRARRMMSMFLNLHKRAILKKMEA